MMTEIGLAQQRLLDDEASSAGQRLPSTATPYSSEISQPGSFPAAAMYQYQQMEENVNDGFLSARAGQDVLCEATQLVPPVQGHVYDYSTPGTSTHNDSPMAVSENMAARPASVRAHLSQKSIHRSKSLQSVPYSPHDTEPLSSVVSPRLSRAKSDNAKWGPMSPPSPDDTHDELSLPAVAVEISTVKKKRGRPKKSSLPDDEDDELAGPQDSGSEQPKPEKKRPGRPRKTVVDDTAADETVQGDANTTDALEIASKESKKAKTKRSKTADAILQNSHASASDDDVIWVQSKPISTNEAKAQNDNTSDPTETNPSGTHQRVPKTTTELSLESEETPTTKKRGRKRKKTAEQLAPEPDETTKENQPPEPPTNTTASEEQEKPPAMATESLEVEAGGNTTPDPTTATNTTHPTTPKEAAPQTPQRSEQTKSDPSSNTNLRSITGPRQHSPISSTSKVPYRVGLSKRARIAPLLKIVRK